MFIKIKGSKLSYFISDSSGSKSSQNTLKSNSLMKSVVLCVILFPVNFTNISSYIVFSLCSIYKKSAPYPLMYILMNSLFSIRRVVITFEYKTPPTALL